ncbi:MAG: nuclear transport factor 2 family protein [Solirubrobacteraceae bacterium]
MSRDPDSASVVRRYVAAVAGDQQGIRELFAQDATWTLAAGDLPISGTWRGRDTILEEFLATALSHYQPGSVSLEITGLIADGDRVALQWTAGRAPATATRTRRRLHRRVHHPRRQDPADPRYMDTLYAAAAFSRAPRPPASTLSHGAAEQTWPGVRADQDSSSATWSAGSCETSGGGRPDRHRSR